MNWQEHRVNNRLHFDNFVERTVEAIIKKLLGLQRLERLGQGKATRYRVIR